MANGTVQVFTVTIASGASTSAEVDLGRGFAKVYIDQTATESAMFSAAPAAAGTHKFLKYPVVSGLSTPATCTVGTACSGSLVDVSVLAGVRFVKVIASNTITDGATVKLYGADV